MRVYLEKDLPGKGKAGDIIEVNDGYAKNFVIKNKIGVAVTNEILSKVKARQESDTFHTEQEKAKIKELILKIVASPVTLTAKVGENGKMFGSITSLEIAKALLDSGFDIDKRNIVLPEPIKMIGAYKIKLKFGHGLEGHVDVNIVAG